MSDRQKDLTELTQRGQEIEGGYQPTTRELIDLMSKHALECMSHSKAKEYLELGASRLYRLEQLEKENARLHELVGEVEEIVTCSSTVFQNMWDKGESLSMIMQEVLCINESIFTKIKEQEEK